MDIEILMHKFCDHALFVRGRAKNTIKGYKKVITLYIRRGGVQKIDQVNRQNVCEFFLFGRRELNWKATTYIHSYHNLMVFFRWCVSNGYMKENPIEDMELPRLEKTLPKALTSQQALRILEVVYNLPYEFAHKYLRCRNHAIFSMFIFAGLRKSELLRLKFADIDIDNLTIFVRQGKGAKDRMIPMSYTLAQSLKRYLVERKRLHKTCPEVFVSLRLNQGFTDSGLKRLVRKIVKVSGIKFTIHQLRHTFGTLMLEGGCDVFSLSKMMGHSNIKTTTIYLSASAKHLRFQVSKHPMNDLMLH